LLTIAANLGNERLMVSQQDLTLSPKAEVIFDYGEAWKMLKKNVLPGNAFIALIEG